MDYELEKCMEDKVKQGGFVDGSHEWKRQGSGDCERVVREESGVSKSSRHGAKRRDSLTYMIFDRKLTELEIVVVKFSE